jgi:hypothetical protein
MLTLGLDQNFSRAAVSTDYLRTLCLCLQPTLPSACKEQSVKIFVFVPEQHEDRSGGNHPFRIRGFCDRRVSAGRRRYPDPQTIR